MSGMTDGGQRATDFLAVVLENVELRQQLAEVQDQCIELAVDTGLHGGNLRSFTGLTWVQVCFSLS